MPETRTPECPSGISPSASAHAPLLLRYVSPEEAVTGFPGETVLAEIRFGGDPALPSAHPTAHVAMEQPDDTPAVELWTNKLSVQYGESHGIHFAINNELLIGTASNASPVASDDFEEQVRKIYHDIFALTEKQGYPHLLRMWNYIPGINLHHDGQENYQRFCHARAQAFQERYGEFTFLLLSASAIGTRQGSFTIYFIASRNAGVQRENPRQVSAYHYPPQYGRRSPSFARATLEQSGDHERLYISGTASIVGHQSLHAGNMQAQMDETLHNIEMLIRTTAAERNTRFRSLADIDFLKIYLRHATDVDIARELIQRRIGTRAQTLYLTGDICRRELLVEVEAVIGCR